MNDGYEYSASAWNEVFGGSKYVFTQRDFSAELITRAIAAVFEKYSGNLDETPMPTAEDYLNGRLYAARIPGIGGAPFDQMDVAVRAQARSEEHTSELQSLMRISYAVFCLKKKKQMTRKK